MMYRDAARRKRCHVTLTRSGYLHVCKLRKSENLNIANYNCVSWQLRRKHTLLLKPSLLGGTIYTQCRVRHKNWRADVHMIVYGDSGLSAYQCNVFGNTGNDVKMSLALRWSCSLAKSISARDNRIPSIIGHRYNLRLVTVNSAALVRAALCTV